MLARSLAVAAAVSLVVACSPAAPAPSEANAGAAVVPAPPPNVLLIVLDTARADRCGFIGYDRDTTPSLDRIARGGVTYVNAWSPAGWTGPAHASLFTGLRPEHHRFVLGVDPALREDAVTLAERLRDAGYRTAAHSCNAFVSDEFGLLQGFDTREILNGADRAVDRLAERAQRRTRDWIERGTGQWFAFLNVMEPHLPYTPPWEHERQFLRAGVPAARLGAMRDFDFPLTIAHMTGEAVLSEDDLAVLSDLYDAEIATADVAVGRLLGALRASGELDRTIVVIVSDHGENLGEHGLVAHRFSLHRTIRHVPLLIRYPPAMDAGRVERRTVRLEDVCPTVLELCGLEPIDGLDGASLVGDVGMRVAPAIQGPIPEEFRERVRALYAGDALERLFVGQRAVFDGRHHLIVHDDGHEELYDVTDSLESNDMRATHPHVAEDLRSRLPPAVSR